MIEGQKTAKCRNCGMELKVSYGGYLHPTKKNEHGGRLRLPSCHYGGAVCSKHCDKLASLALEQTMPGHGYSQRKVQYATERDIDAKWGGYQ